MDPPDDWRGWPGAMALLNALGLVVYHISGDLALWSGRGRTQSVWQMNRERFAIVTEGVHVDYPLRG